MLVGMDDVTGPRVIGAGVGRTGTESLKLALERLLGGPCHHMREVHRHPEEIPVWHAAVLGDAPDWRTFLAGYRATVDFPSSLFWAELAEAFPDAPVVLSTRDSAATWWRSARRTIFSPEILRPPEDGGLRHELMTMVRDLFTHRFRLAVDDPASMMAAYDGHNAAVRAGVAPERLVEWRPGDGWAPLCEALGVGVPDEPFPHVNSTEDFRARAGLDTGDRT